MRRLTEAERAQRREALADHALTLFAQRGWSKLTVEAVAEAAGVAKGSVFLAFASKEDLGLFMAGRQLDRWFERLRAVDPTRPVPDLARSLVATLHTDPLLLPLLALVGPVLESGCTDDVLLGFKEGLAAQLTALTRRWADQRPEIARERWVPWFLRVWAALVGSWVVGETSARVRAVLEPRPDLAFLLTTFDQLFLPLLEAELRAMVEA